LKEGEKYQQVAVLESEVQVDSYIRENNQCGFTKAQKKCKVCSDENSVFYFFLN